MSSVGAADRNRASEELRQAREEFENREANSAKRHRKEMKTVTDKHRNELDKVQKAYQSNIDEMKERNKETMTTRDQKNSDDIKRVREIYLSQIKKNSEDNELQKDAYKSSYENEIDRERKVNSNRTETLNRNFRANLEERDKNLADLTTRSNVKLKEEINSRTEKIKNKFDKELHSVVEDRDRLMEQQSHDVANLKRTQNEQMHDLQRQARFNQDKERAHFDSVLSTTNATHEEMLNNRNELLQVERKRMQKRFNGILDERINNLAQAEMKLKDDATERIDRELRVANSDRMKSEQQRILDNISAARIKNITEKHMNEQFQDRLNDVERQKQEMRESFLSVTDKRIEENNHKINKVIQETNRRHRMDQNIRDQQGRDAIANLEFTSKNQIEHTNNQADKRIRRIMNSSNDAQNAHLKQSEANLEQLKSNYIESLSGQRESQMEQIQQMRIDMEARLREQMLKGQKKHEETVANYEQQIEKLKETSMNDLQRLKDSYEQRLVQRDKALKLERDSQEMKNKTRIVAQEETHQKDLERIEKRHQEQMANLAARIKSYEKKV